MPSPLPLSRTSLVSALSLVIALTAMSGCADRPDLTDRGLTPLDPSLAWPRLLDTSELAQITATEVATSDEEAVSPARVLSARAAALDARGRRLSAEPVLSEQERLWLLAAIARHDAAD